MKNINYSIPRTRLFFNNYLPGAIMSHRHGMYGYVVGTNSRQEQVDKVNYSLLKEVVSEQAELWRSMGGDVDGNLESAIENGTLVVRSPSIWNESLLASIAITTFIAPIDHSAETLRLTWREANPNSRYR